MPAMPESIVANLNTHSLARLLVTVLEIPDGYTPQVRVARSPQFPFPPQQFGGSAANAAANSQTVSTFVALALGTARGAWLRRAAPRRTVSHREANQCPMAC